ncbi:hypothetical protein D9M72_536320 [compost metagenome]
MGGRAHFWQPDLAGRDRHRDFLGHFPVRARIDQVPDHVAGEGKLATVAPGLVLIDDAADGFRIGRIADAIENHLSDGRLALERLAARFEIDAFGQAGLLFLAEYGRGQHRCRPSVVVRRDFGNEAASVLVLAQDRIEG